MPSLATRLDSGVASRLYSNTPSHDLYEGLIPARAGTRCGPSQWSCRESNPMAPLRDWLDVDPVVETVFSVPAGVPSAALSHGVDESSRFCLPLCVDLSPTIDCGDSAAEQPSDAVGQARDLGLGCNTVGGNWPVAVIGDDRSSEATGVPAGSALSALHAVDLLVVHLHDYRWALLTS